ncbi:dienelactone hydrolase family protein [Streptomyces sp. NPDC005931]|uniref:dienelactone hydrolase family protein n=1 Tax=Streptomyces sp. NPDC005931 TaxID=3364737 RepID=UPI0036971F53
MTAPLATPRVPGSPARSPGRSPAATGPASDHDVEVGAGSVALTARLALPATVRAVVVFTHGGSNRPDAALGSVTAALGSVGVGSLVLDVLSGEELRDRHNAFDIVLLARRLRAASHWVRQETALPVAYFGSGTGAGAALEAAAGDDIRAVVSCGGRPDLASPAALSRLRAPTLLLVGGLDTRVLGRNRIAADWMLCEHRVVAVRGVADLFTEPGAMDTVADVARDWFTAHLAGPDAAAPPPLSA